MEEASLNRVPRQSRVVNKRSTHKRVGRLIKNIYLSNPGVKAIARRVSLNQNPLHGLGLGVFPPWDFSIFSNFYEGDIEGVLNL